jgi:hypothetical protein
MSDWVSRVPSRWTFNINQFRWDKPRKLLIAHANDLFAGFMSPMTFEIQGRTKLAHFKFVKSKTGLNIYDSNDVVHKVHIYVNTKY